jgi:type II secretory ATPase GspE/PulE/Tfp pilus assembly ATPase PilB-like protein
MPKNARAVQTQSAEFGWPPPAAFVSTSIVSPALGEPCEVDMRDGSFVEGKLVRFSPDATAIYVREPGFDTREIQLSELKAIRLTRELITRRDPALKMVQRFEVGQSNNTQAFILEFASGQIASGETAGMVRDARGVFLFPQSEDGKIVRLFVPVDMVRQLAVGDLTGKLLVEHDFATPEQIAAAVVRQRELRTRPLGEVLIENQLVTQAELQKAIEYQKSMPIMRLGDALKHLGLLTEEQLEAGLARQREQRNVPLGRILVDMGIVSDGEVKQVLAKKLGIPFVDLKRMQLDVDSLKLVPANFAIQNRLLPLYRREMDLVVAVEDPLNDAPLKSLRVMTSYRVVPVMATAEAITARISELYGNGGAGLKKLERDTAPDRRELPFTMGTGGGQTSSSNSNGDLKFERADDLATKLFEEGAKLEIVRDEAPEQVRDTDSTLVRIVNKMILDAQSSGASDIHIESYPGDKNTRIRFRRDGVMAEYLQVPSSHRGALVSRLKIMASLDISEKRKPQDGKIEFPMGGGRPLELRVASIPTTGGLEDMVLRILASSKPVGLHELGMEPDNLTALESIASKSYGLILVCGPTGSGKTTTLHSVLGHINKPGVKIWTAEDPVEITQEGLRQVQVNSKIGWTFATAMRAFLRADPDVIMVGEMRDEETAKIGVEAALTGHLVLSTLHTNTAPDSVTRLLEMGIDPFNFSDSLLGVTSQRLVRKLCTNCSRPRPAGEDELTLLADEYCHGTTLHRNDVMAGWRARFGDAPTLHEAIGCATCERTGYRGRAGIHEMLVNTPELRRLIQKRAPSADLFAQALADGMRTLKQDGILKSLQGVTDLQQVRAACN